MTRSLFISFQGQLKDDAVQEQGRKTTFNYPCESTSDCYPYEVKFKPGTYQIECIGAGSQQNENLFSYGAKTKGVIHFLETTTLYLYVGSSLGKFNALPPEVNTNHGYMPCGASDLRTIGGNYWEFKSLMSRIMVAGAGGSSDNYNGVNGHGGTLQGDNAYIGECNSGTNLDYDPLLVAPGGKQTNDYSECTHRLCLKGSFGLSGYKITDEQYDAGAFGGSGYYGGCSFDGSGKGGGGSSFISGHRGCDAINENSTDF